MQSTTTEQPAPTQPTAGWYRWVVLAVGTLGIFAALGLARFGYATVLRAMQQDLSFSNATAGMMQSVNLTGYLVLAVIGGALASRCGTRVVAAVGLVVLGCSMVFTGYANGFTALCAWRAVTGLGSGAANVAIMGAWPAWFEPRLRGRAAGIAVSGSSFALILTGLTVPRMLQAQADAWRTVWLLFGAIALGVAVLAWAVLRNGPARPSSSGTDSPAGKQQAGLLSVYGSPKVWHLGAVYIAFGFSYIIYMTFFSRYLSGEQGYSEVAAGRLFMLVGVCSVFCGFLWGAASDVFGRRAALAAVFLVQAASFALFAFPQLPGAILVSALLFGFTAWSIPAIMAAACGDLLGHRLAAAGLGFITLFFGIGQAFGPYVAGAIADATRSFSGAFLLAAAVAFLGALGSLLLPRQHTFAVEQQAASTAAGATDAAANAESTHPTVGKTCPYCQTPLKPGVEIVTCNACGMPHHTDCWRENGRCTTYGCDGEPVQR
ncbi:MAG: MFS transporter [Armatimonadota bacterium]